MADNVELLTAHHLPFRVLNIIEEAQDFVVLVTAYLKSWTHLDHALKAAVARGVPVTVILRSPDGAKRDREKRTSEAKALEALGANVHYVDRLHAKAYVNEKAAIVTSFNLVSGSNESIELGVLIQDHDLVDDCIAKIRTYCPELDDPRQAGKATERALISAAAETGHCIGCAEHLPRNPEKPLCRSCYRSSKKGSDLTALPERGCHFCGGGHAATLARPICQSCWKKIPKQEQATITASLAKV